MMPFLKIWLNVNYIIELLVSCVLFMIPSRKRSHYKLRAWGIALLLVAISYIFNSKFFIPSTSILYFIYWGTYIVLCPFYIWFCADITLTSAVYCASFACAVQHIAHDIYMFAEVITGKGYLYSLPGYLFAYALAYFVIVRKKDKIGNYEIGKNTAI